MHLVSLTHIRFQRRGNLKFCHFLPQSKGPQGAGVLNFSIYVSHVLRMHHTKFEKNWSGSYQEVKNVQLLTHLITDHFAPP
jgi:hypothetical protein